MSEDKISKIEEVLYSGGNSDEILRQLREIDPEWRRSLREARPPEKTTETPKIPGNHKEKEGIVVAKNTNAERIGQVNGTSVAKKPEKEEDIKQKEVLFLLFWIAVRQR